MCECKRGLNKATYELNVTVDGKHRLTVDVDKNGLGYGESVCEADVVAVMRGVEQAMIGRFGVARGVRVTCRKTVHQAVTRPF